MKQSIINTIYNSCLYECYNHYCLYITCFMQVGDGGFQTSKLKHHPDGFFDIPEHIKPVTDKMRVEVSETNDYNTK